MQNTTSQVAVVAFADEAQTGSSGWVNLKNGTLSVIQNDIEWAMNPGFAMGTNFNAALTEAENVMTSLPQTPIDRTLNYLIFLSDGQDRGGDFLSIADSLVNSFGVAIMTVALGEEAIGGSTLQDLALPKSNSSKPNHIGAYYTAQSGSDLDNVWEGLFADLAKCE